MTDEPTRPIPVIALFRQTAQEMVDQLVQRLHAAGFQDLTAAHHPVFENLDPEGTRLTVLAARTRMTHQSMGELVQGLELRGYVARRPDPCDRRARLVHLTAKGRRAARTAVAEIAEIERVWLDCYRRSGFDGDLRSLLESALRTPTE